MPTQSAKPKKEKFVPIPESTGGPTRATFPVFGIPTKTSDEDSGSADTPAEGKGPRTKKSSAEVHFLANPSPEAQARNDRPASWQIVARYNAGALPESWYAPEFEGYLEAIGAALFYGSETKGWTDWDTILVRANDLLIWTEPPLFDFPGEGSIPSAQERRRELKKAIRDAYRRITAPKDEEEK